MARRKADKSDQPAGEQTRQDQPAPEAESPPLPAPSETAKVQAAPEASPQGPDSTATVSSEGAESAKSSDADRDAQGPPAPTEPPPDPDATDRPHGADRAETLQEAAGTPEPVPEPEARSQLTPEPESASHAMTGESLGERAPTPAAAPAPRRGIGVPVLGGALAAAIGFGLAQVVPQGWPIGQDSARLDAIESRLAAQEALPQLSPDTLGTLMGRLSELEAGRAAQASRDDLLALSGRIEALEQPIAALTGQIAALEAQIAGQGSAQPQSADLDALRALIEAERAALAAQAETIRRDLEAQVAAMIQLAEAQTEALRDEAARARAASVVRGAVLMLRAALESGESLSEAIEALKDAGIEPPAALLSLAEGVPTMAMLHSDFPAAARAALALARTGEAEADDLASRVWAFLLRQVGARSLAPREGDDADAVLSRAEAALRQGELGATLALLGELAPAVAAPFAQWKGMADSRLAAQQALADLARAHGLE